MQGRAQARVCVDEFRSDRDLDLFKGCLRLPEVRSGELRHPQLT